MRKVVRKPEEDAYWDAMLERLDMDDSEMAEAERRLQEVGEERLETEQVEAIVERASAPVQLRALPVIPTRRLSVAAAVLIAFLMTTGLTAITVIVVNLLWSEGANSNQSMSYSLAIKLLAHPEQPEKPDKMAALSTAHERVNHGIGVLRMIRDDSSSPQLLVEATGNHLARLRRLAIGDLAVDQIRVDETLETSAMRARDGNLGIDERLAMVDHIAHLTAGGISGIRNVVNPTLGVASACKDVLRRILAEIDHQ